MKLKTLSHSTRFTTSEGNRTVDKLVMLLQAVDVRWKNKHQSTKRDDSMRYQKTVTIVLTVRKCNFPCCVLCLVLYDYYIIQINI